MLTDYRIYIFAIVVRRWYELGNMCISSKRNLKKEQLFLKTLTDLTISRQFQRQGISTCLEYFLKYLKYQ